MYRSLNGPGLALDLSLTITVFTSTSHLSPQDMGYLRRPQHPAAHIHIDTDNVLTGGFFLVCPKHSHSIEIQKHQN